jgi:hypothetical protein
VPPAATSRTWFRETRGGPAPPDKKNDIDLVASSLRSAPPDHDEHSPFAGRLLREASLGPPSQVDNDVYGSIRRCADDFRPGRWYDDANRWSGCDVTY